MGRRVTFADRAKTDLRAIPQETAIQILHTLARFLDSEDGDVKKLQGIVPPLYRLRAQDYRVMFRDRGTHIEVTRVQNRRDAYR
ncbi:MAG TPA: type II toxin-antitoxin system RelE/ParE family toxin [Bryobacteraceae bacterium]|nr:type II toxin-antitoxin system RelE/ParE family toxin [Bryobacteraceae bacterium]